MSAPAEMSASAKKRARQKANAAAKAAEETAAAAPEPEPAPKSKAKAKAASPAPAPAPDPPAGKAKAKGKAKAAPEPEPAPKAEAKAKPKAKAAAEPKQAAAPEPKASAKGKAKAKAKAKAEDEDEAPKQEKSGRLFYQEIDDGSRAGEWETATGLDKKKAKQKERQEEKKAQEKEAVKAGAIAAKGNQHIPGLAPVAVQVAQAKGAAKAKSKAGAPAVSQAVTSVAVVSAVTAAAKEKEPEKAAAPVDNNVSETVKVPEKRIGVVVGPKGANIQLIKEKIPGIKNIDISGDMCTIIGLPDAVPEAVHAVTQLIEKGFMALAYDDFEEEGVPVLPTDFPNIIGQKGAIIMEIKKQAKVEIDIPPVPKNAPQGKKFKVNIAGSKAGVALGKEIINSIVTWGHHEITHPGQIHKEMEIEEWRYRFLIGSKGSEMRHIQNNFSVKVNIPREHSACKNVVIVGETRDVERAIKYIEKIMYEADQPKGRGAPERATDDGGDDGEIEDWMRPYMYQRK